MKLYCEVLEGDAVKFECLVETVVFFAIVCAEFSSNCGGFAPGAALVRFLQTNIFQLLFSRTCSAGRALEKLGLSSFYVDEWH